MTSIVLPENNDRRDVWVSGTENVHLVTDLIDSKDENERATGRTSRLACKYADLAMQYPDCRIVVVDHYDTLDAHRRLSHLVTRILDIVGVEWETGVLDRVERDPNSFTGVRNASKAVFVRVVLKSSQQT